jgi:hypothetical protein
MEENREHRNRPAYVGRTNFNKKYTEIQWWKESLLTKDSTTEQSYLKNWTLKLGTGGSEGRDQEDHGLKPAPGKQFSRHYLENTQHKQGWQNVLSGRVPA